MSKVRRQSAAQIRVQLCRRPGECTQCGGLVPKGRKTFCGKACVELFNIANDPGYARLLVQRRDKGVCCRCGVDTKEIRDLLYKLRRHCYELGGPAFTFYSIILAEHRDLANWECDHTTPVVEGGGQCGLDNLRTLCCRCHKVETKELAARRAKERAAEKRAATNAGARS